MAEGGLSLTLASVRAALNRSPMCVAPPSYDGMSMVKHSILKRISEYSPGGIGVKAGLAQQETLLVVRHVDMAVQRAVAAFVGNAIGDGVGAPLEFIPCDSSLPPFQLAQKAGEGRMAFLKTVLDDQGELEYINEYNNFQLFPGQWTDDFSMAQCLADSLLVCGAYQGGDCRARYFAWWTNGYNNAFRFDNPPRSSVGLGGNISKSLQELEAFIGKPSTAVPEIYAPNGPVKEDAGNGSLMRLSPIPIRYHSNVRVAMGQAERSSLATHPGTDASACCRFLSYFVVRAIHRPADCVMLPSEFLAAAIKDFELEASAVQPVTTGMRKVLQLLSSAPPTPCEACWNWKAERLPLEEAIAARGKRYNGYPVTPGYFGAYSMDGLAMSLWGFNGSLTFSECILRVVNLLGDCDTTGAIAGQMAGAFYGYQAISTDSMGKKMLSNLRRWDPFCEIEWKAMLLYEDGTDESLQRSGVAAPQQVNK